MTAAAPILELVEVHHRWPRQRSGLHIPAFRMARGERVFLRGPSGSGKSTLLNLIAGTVAPASGRIVLGEVDLVTVRQARRDRERADRIGVVFQQFNLLPFLDMVGNVTLPCRFSRRRLEHARRAHGTPEAAAGVLLQALGLSVQAQSGQAVAELSVGQQQRVAVARALIGGPELVLADEPTSALDADARSQFMQLLLGECERSGTAVLFVSHDPSLAADFHRVVDLPRLLGNAAVPEHQP